MKISQKVACLIDGNNIGIAGQKIFNNRNLMLDFENLVPKLVGDRDLTKLFYFREGTSISEKFQERLHKNFYGVAIPCFKSADSVLTITAIQIADKVDTIMLFSGDIDYLHLIRFLKTKGVRIELVAFRQSVHHLLFDEVDNFYNIQKEDMFEYVYDLSKAPPSPQRVSETV